MLIMASITMGFALMVMTWSTMTVMSEKNIMIRRLYEYSKRQPKKEGDGIVIAPNTITSDAVNTKKSLFKSLTWAFFMSLPCAYGWYFFDPGRFANKWLVCLLILTIVFRIRHIQAIKRYHLNIEENLPRTMDLLIICIEAGMSINSALMRVAEETKGTPISEEFKLTFHELNAGLSVEDAFQNMSDRTNVPDLLALTTAIVQSESLGIGLVDTLRSHSVIMRESLRLRTKEKIVKLPVKMILPLVIFIMPAIFTILGGPVYIQIKDSLVHSLQDTKPIVDKAKENRDNEAY